MVKLKIDKQSHYKNKELVQRENNSIVFYQEDWNDFGYKVHFRAYYYNESGKEYEIGSYKIFHTQQAISDWNAIQLSEKTVRPLEEDGFLNDVDFSS